MNDPLDIDVPESYLSLKGKAEAIPRKDTIKKIPNSTNKVRVKIIRGVLKGDGCSSN